MFKASEPESICNLTQAEAHDEALDAPSVAKSPVATAMENPWAPAPHQLSVTLIPAIQSQSSIEVINDAFRTAMFLSANSHAVKRYYEN